MFAERQGRSVVVEVTHTQLRGSKMENIPTCTDVDLRWSFRAPLEE